VKHGCTNYVKECWKKTVEGLKPFIGNEEALQQELFALKLLSKPFTLSQESMRRLGGKQKEKKERKKRKPRETTSASMFI